MPEAGTRHRILFVDDAPSHLKTTRLILEDAGFEVHTAATGQEALQLARQVWPDLILLDVVLPDTTGYDVCQQLKLDPDTMDTVVLLLSGLGSSSEERTAGLEWGADGYLAKPVFPNELVAHIYALLRIRYAEQRAKAASRDADESRARLAAIMEASDVAIIGTDLKGTVLGWNPAAERLFGYTADEMRGGCITRIFPNEVDEERKKVWIKVCNDDHVRGYDTVRMAKGGISLPLFVNICPIRDSDGQIIGVTETARRRPLAGEAPCQPIPDTKASQADV
jgi:PAS domain S-box-containing protein